MATRQENVRALVRGLEILRHVNDQGACRPAEIAKALDIPRPTVYRLLRTMEEAGYILYSASDTRVRVSPLASGLGDNSAGRSRLCEIATPKMVKFTDDHVWPLDLSVYSDLRMIVEETTHWRSPMSIDSNMAGATLPMLRSSSGRAYLSFCETREREIILQLLHKENHKEDKAFLDSGDLAHRFQQYRSQGFAVRGPRTFRPNTSSLAVPICHQDRVIGCLSVIWITSAISMAEAECRYVTPLVNLAEGISALM